MLKNNPVRQNIIYVSLLISTSVVSIYVHMFILTRIFYTRGFAYHSALQSNLILLNLLLTSDAISESQYVKIGSMCNFFLISPICLLENVTFMHFKCTSKSCSISIKQRNFHKLKLFNVKLFWHKGLRGQVGKHLDQNSSLFALKLGHGFESQLRTTFLVIFWPKISSH